MINKQIKLVNIIKWILAIAGFIFIIYAISGSFYSINYKTSCLKQTATDYCVSQNMSFDSMNRLIYDNNFKCNVNSQRSSDGYKFFNFLDSEMKECHK